MQYAKKSLQKKLDGPSHEEPHELEKNHVDCLTK
jgi:hypothetical protein